MDDPLDLCGQVLEGKYAVAEAVGEGGFALVYRAMHLVLKRPVAIKVFHSAAKFTDRERDALVAAFLLEASLLEELSEKTAAICQARDVGMVVTKSGQLPFIVLEWMEGRTLEAMLDEEWAAQAPARALDEVLRWLEPIGHALALAHERGISHRDVKPANIFIVSGQLKLLDFGVAKVVQQTESLSRDKTPTPFTPAYGAPEQFSGYLGTTGTWTDVFALALLLTEMIAGKSALQGDTFAKLKDSACNLYVRPTPRTLGVRIADEHEEVFAKALAVSPGDRYATAGEFWSALVEGGRNRPLPALVMDAIPASRREAPARFNLPSAAEPASAAVMRHPQVAARPRPERPREPASAPSTALRALIGVGAILAIASGALVGRESWGYVQWQREQGYATVSCRIEESRGGILTVSTMSAVSVRGDVREQDLETPALPGFGGADPEPPTFSRAKGADVRCFYDAGPPPVFLLRRYASFAVWPLEILGALFATSLLGTLLMARRLRSRANTSSDPGG